MYVSTLAIKLTCIEKIQTMGLLVLKCLETGLAFICGFFDLNESANGTISIYLGIKKTMLIHVCVAVIATESFDRF